MYVAAALIAAGYLGMLALLYFAQRALLYLPSRSVADPAAFGLSPEIRLIKTRDGETLRAWWFAPSAGRPVILYFHGNGGGLDGPHERFKRFLASGDGVLAVEYRGYPGSSGKPTEAGLILDGEAGYAEALSLGADPKRLVVFGESLGSGVAVALAATHPVGALVLDSPFTSTVDVAADRYWMFPVRTLMRDTFHSDERIADVHAPLLIVHGTADWTVPVRFGERLFALANEPKRFILVPGAGHLALSDRMTETLAWIDATLGG